MPFEGNTLATGEILEYSIHFPYMMGCNVQDGTRNYQRQYYSYSERQLNMEYIETTASFPFSAYKVMFLFSQE